jgi:hypothetical protein
MNQRLPFIIGLVLAGMFAFVTSAFAESIVVSPAAGYRTDTFVFVGADFRPGARMEALFTLPDGSQFVFVDGQTKERARVIADEQGSWTFTILPDDLRDIPPGQIGVKFCGADTNFTENCYVGSFTLLD